MTTTVPYQNINDLGSPHGENAAAQFTALERMLQEAGGQADIQRLHNVSRDAPRLDFSALERVAAPDLIVETLTKHHRAAARHWMGARNAMALVPLLLTWGFLALAASDYRQLLEVDPTKIDQPFLLLWEQGFGGSIMPSFSAAAACTCLLLMTVLVMTWMAHRSEGQAASREAESVILVDDALSALQTAIDHERAKTPVSAEEWVRAAQRILADTQKVLAETVRQTAELTTANREITANAAKTLGEIHDKTIQYIADYTDSTSKTLDAIRDEHSQLLERTGQKAVDLLDEANLANRDLIKQQMKPLVDDFRATLADFNAQHETYRVSADGLADSAREMAGSAAALEANTKYYTQIAESIDKHLDGVEQSQRDFASKITVTADSMTVTAQSMVDVVNVMGKDLKNDLKDLATSAVDAGHKIVQVNSSLDKVSTALASAGSQMDISAAAFVATTTNLTSFTGAMNTSASAMQKAASDISAVASGLGTGGRRKWPWS